MIKVFRWSSWFCPGMESCLAPVWVAMPSLPHCYYKHGFIKTVARAYGTLLSIATPTSTGSTVVCARFCVEMDLSKDYPTEIYVGTESKGGFQPVKFENRPAFCSGCSKLGHVFSSCRRNPDSTYKFKESSR